MTELRGASTAEALRRTRRHATGCLSVMLAVYADLAGDTLVRPGFLNEPAVARYLTLNTTRDKAVRVCRGFGQR